MDAKELREIIIEEIDFGRTHLAQDKDITDNIMIDVEQYANQRVIEEVDEFKLWLYKEYSDKFIDIDITLLYKLFKKLKQ